MRRTGHADLPLHGGTVPKWLTDRMMQMGTLIVESLVLNFGRREVLQRLSDPLWFQSFGAVMGMDWHSSGITTSVMYALKRGLNPLAKELGIVVCGGRGKYSRRTPEELTILSDLSGLDGNSLIRSSKLCAKVDNTAVQDGFQLYQHNFIVTSDGDWAVVQQGMNSATKSARRYHWCSLDLASYVESPHSGVVGENRGSILNLTAQEARPTRSSILTLSKEEPERVLKEAAQILCTEKPVLKDKYTPGELFNDLPSTSASNSSFSQNTALSQDSLFTQDSLFPRDAGYKAVTLPAHHEVRREDVNLKRLGAVLATAYKSEPADFESLLLTEGLGPRTLQSLTLVSEVINGTPSRFTDPARFSFAHGGKDGHPFPVPLKIYDESIRVLQESIERSKLGYNDKSDCIRRLHKTALTIEQNCAPEADFEATLKHEWENTAKWGGRTVTMDYSKQPQIESGKGEKIVTLRF